MKKFTEQNHADIDQAIDRLTKESSGKQFVRGHRRGEVYRVGRFVPVRGEKAPRLLSWIDIKLGEN